MVQEKKSELNRRPDKYAEKVFVNVEVDEMLQIFSDAAHSNVADEEESECEEDKTE